VSQTRKSSLAREEIVRPNPLSSPDEESLANKLDLLLALLPTRNELSKGIRPFVALLPCQLRQARDRSSCGRARLSSKAIRKELANLARNGGAFRNDGCFGKLALAEA
jgi:hypothetical protein